MQLPTKMSSTASDECFLAIKRSTVNNFRQKCRLLFFWQAALPPKMEAVLKALGGVSAC